MFVLIYFVFLTVCFLASAYFNQRTAFLLSFSLFMISMILFIVGGVFVIPRDMGWMFPMLNMFVGAGALGLWMIPGALGPDVQEYEELHHGNRHEGGFYGIWMLVQKTGGGIALFAMGILPPKEQQAQVETEAVEELPAPAVYVSLDPPFTVNFSNNHMVF